MPVVRKANANVPVAGVEVDLGVFNRFGGRGGAISVRGTSNAVNTFMTVQVGSDIVADRFEMPIEAVTGQGPNNETPAIQAVGAPGDPIMVKLFGTAATEDTIVQVDITNL